MVFPSADHSGALWLYLPEVIWRGVPPSTESMVYTWVKPCGRGPLPSAAHASRLTITAGLAHCALRGFSGSLTARIGSLSASKAVKAIDLPSGDQLIPLAPDRDE